MFELYVLILCNCYVLVVGTGCMFFLYVLVVCTSLMYYLYVLFICTSSVF